VHLLLHGIWAFKAHTTGERTDLVFQEPICDTIAIERSADALVLTEWKVCTNQSLVVSKLAEARSQAERYRVGALGGLELTRYRYLVLVSQTHLGLPSDGEADGVVFRNINIAVQPNRPSQDSNSTGAQVRRDEKTR
jgi:hypothetical protein